MRRTDREITDRATLEGILAEAEVCRLGMSDHNRPYIIPMNFAYHDNSLYFHCAREGKKLDILRDNSEVCFEVDVRTQVVPSEKACNWAVRYFSVVGFGTVTIVDDFAQKCQALQHIMRKHSGRGDWSFTENVVNTMLVLRVDISQMSGKKSRYERWLPIGETGSEGDAKL